MDRVISESGRWLRWVHEYLFSLNLAWAVVWIERVRNSGNFIAYYRSKLVREPYQMVAPIGGHTIFDQLLWSFVLAALVFCSLRLLSRLVVSNAALRIIAGAAAIVGFPLACMFVPYAFVSADIRVGAYHRALLLELIFVLICGTLYYLRKPPLSIPLMVLVLCLHFAIWAWIASCYVNVPVFISTLRSSEYYHPWRRTLGSLSLAMAFNLGFPVLGLVASLSWVRYVRFTSITDD